MLSVRTGFDTLRVHLPLVQSGEVDLVHLLPSCLLVVPPLLLLLLDPAIMRSPPVLIHFFKVKLLLLLLISLAYGLVLGTTGRHSLGLLVQVLLT